MGWVLDKPEYFFRPTQLIRRLWRSMGPPSAEPQILSLPWGPTLEAPVTETIGHSLWHLGVYDLVVGETLWRLADPGESAADIGANIGYMTSLLANRTGPRGNVLAFEPHPHTFARLERNVARWPGQDRIHRFALALSDHAGEGALLIPGDFGSNSGTAYLRGATNLAPSVGEVVVPLSTLDEVCEAKGLHPVVAKIDTEGNEAQVLNGARRQIERGTLRDVVFEDHGAFPTAAMKEVLDGGYALFRLKKNFWGPALEDPASVRPTGLWEPLSYLATRDPQRARARMRPRGWRSLGR